MMKKTFMALCFAMCATAAFAQTGTIVSRSENAINQVQQISFDELNKAQQAGYKGSIFTKTGELMLQTFASDSGYTTGTLTSSDLVNGTNVEGHTQTTYHSTWHRIADTTTATCTALRNAGNYPATFGTSSGFRSLHGIDSETPMNGLMVMTMQDQISAWGGSGVTGNFNAYIAFDAFSTLGAQLVEVDFYQYYRCFNADQCFIDYSTDGTTWNAVEFNVARVDVSVNSALLGWKRVTLPASVANQSTVYLRIRWACSSNGGGAYGYLWFLDDVSVSACPADRLTISTNKYFEGFYHMMPQSLNLPVVWASDFSNTGYNTQTNVQGSVYAMSNGQAATQIATSRSISSMVAGAADSLVIDPLGWYGAGSSHGWGWSHTNPSDNPVQGTTGYIPTTDTGVVRVFADITTGNLNHVYDTMTFDTNAVRVTEDGVWARDNGILTKFNSWTYGMNSESTFSSDRDDVMWDVADYTVYNSYVTGNTVPEGWVIQGVEMVAATYPGMAEVGARITPVLRFDSVHDDLVSFISIVTGANTHTVTASDLNSTTDLEYLQPGEYNTIRLTFYEQPELRPHTAYRIGYSLAEDCSFAVGNNRTYYYDLGDSTAQYFRNTPGMEEWGHTFGAQNRYSTLVFDPYDNSNHFFTVSAYPQIRMIVGPRQSFPKTSVSFTCYGETEHGAIYDAGYGDNLCGATDSVIIGGSYTYYVAPEEGYYVQEIKINGVVEYTSPDSLSAEITVPLENISAATTIEATYNQSPSSVGIDPMAAGVSVHMQPNPATTNVQLSISGVTGMVNLAIIDMSGRVISSRNVDASDVQNINVSSLAKGAYFVRITNNNFSKVEKLIVR